MFKSKDSFYSIVKESILRFYVINKKQFHLLLALIFFSSLIDVLSLSAIIPVIYLINDPSPVYTNSVLVHIFELLNFSSPSSFILFLLVCLVVLFFFKNLLLLVSVYFQNKFIYAVAFNLIERQMNGFYKSDYLKIKSKNSAEYLRYLVEAPQVFASSIILPLTLMLSESLVALFIIVALLIYNPVVFMLVFVAIIPVSFIFIKAAKKRLMYISEMKGKLETESHIVTLEGINAYKDIKLFSKETFYTERIKEKFRKQYNANAETNLYEWVPRRIIETLVILTICILYAIVTILFDAPSGGLVLILLSFATAAYRLLPSINEILINMVRVKTSSYALKQLKEIKLEMEFEEFSDKQFSQTIELKDICFKYTENKKSTFTNINLVIHKQDFIVICGESGNGKTTLGNIIAGFITPISGFYLMDNKPVNNFNEIKNLIGYVSQDFYLFDSTIAENIAVGESIDKMDVNRINEALAAANIKSFIDTLPDGIFYKIGEQGVKFSVGQRQRIAIARALYKKAQILVLDEITSALDYENENEILDTIYHISKDKDITVILITHRIAALKKYDKLFKLENGILNQVL